MINNVIQVGHLGSDADVKVFDNGSKITRFQICNGVSYTNKQGVRVDKSYWHIIICRRFLADRASNYRKGDKVTVHGILTYRDYTDSNGIKRQITEIDAHNIEDNLKIGKEQAPFPQEEPAPQSYDAKAKEDAASFQKELDRPSTDIIGGGQVRGVDMPSEPPQQSPSETPF